MKNNFFKRTVSILTTVAILLTVLIVPVSASAANLKKPAKVKLKSVQVFALTSLKVTWKNVERAKGFQIKVSTNSRFTNAKTVNTVNASIKTITKLKSGTKYYVKVRAYTKVNGKWSNVKTVTTKKAVSRRTTSTNTTASVSYGSTYVLNPDSMKVHKQGCRTFKYESQYPTTSDLDGALRNGYSMCGICWR